MASEVPAYLGFVASVDKSDEPACLVCKKKSRTFHDGSRHTYNVLSRNADLPHVCDKQGPKRVCDRQVISRAKWSVAEFGKRESGDTRGGQGNVQGTTKGGQGTVSDDRVEVNVGRGRGRSERIKNLVDFRLVLWGKRVVVYVRKCTGYPSIVCRIKSTLKRKRWRGDGPVPESRSVTWKCVLRSSIAGMKLER